MNVGEKIKQARKKAGLTQEALAKAVGMATISIQQYERNIREPNNAVLVKLASALGLPNAAYFYFDPIPDEDKESPAPDEGEAKINPRYFGLSAEDRAVVDAMIDRLSTAGQSNH